MAEFKELALSREAHAAFLSCPEVQARSAQLKAFAQHQNLGFDAEGLTRVLQMNIALTETQGPLPDAMDFMPGRSRAV